jgi:hypothetical protein
MNQRTLSSAQTYAMKFVFPPIFIASFGGVIMAMFLGAFRGRGNTDPPEAVKFLLLAAWVAGATFSFRLFAPLKRVRADESAIFVSNYRDEIRIPFGEIAAVTENRWINIHPVTIQLRSATAFGNRIVFMPKARLFGWTTHPVVTELRALAQDKGGVL